MTTHDLTDHERRLVLGALWSFRQSTTRGLEQAGDDELHIVDNLDKCDSAARKLGGDPAQPMYGAPSL